MNKTILVAPYLRKFSLKSILIALLFLAAPVFAAVDTHRLFVPLSDAMSAAKANQQAQVIVHLTELQDYIASLAEKNSSAGQAVQKALATAQQHPDIAHLDALAKALYTFEKEQNPIDYAQKRAKFAQRVMPIYQQLQAAVDAQDLTALQTQYKKFNSAWTLNEKAVRDTSLGHYGQIETAMSFLRIALLADPPDHAAMLAQSQALGEALRHFVSGETLAAPDSGTQTLAGGIRLLEQALAHLQSGDTQAARAPLMQFIQEWPIFEGDVRTRDGALYTRVESGLPLILAQADRPESTAHLDTLITELQSIDTKSNYGMIDAMLILLREGVEALLIVMALTTALQAAGQAQGKRWIYAGAALGIAASIGGALALQRLFPAASAGANREILEGLVGIFAVAMMLLVGGWLHGKSSLQGWQRFVDKQLAKALATGSLLSMAFLSFLAVFREGAETILFYAGIVPRTSLADLLAGIALALVLLAVIAFAIHKAGKRLPLHRLFALMTFLIYALGFKILGVSIHALQLTKVLPMHVAAFIPPLPSVGLYASWEGIGAQALYVLMIPLMARLFRH